MTLNGYDGAGPFNLAAAKQHGGIVATVYIVGTPGGMPHADKARVAAIRATGMGAYANWERAADFFRHANLEDCRAAGREALAAVRALGFPEDGTHDVAFSFDYQIAPVEYSAALEKLDACQDGLGSGYRARAYGQFGFVDYLGHHGHPGPHWLMASTWRSTSQFTAREVGSPFVGMVQSHDAAGNWISSPVAGTDINTVTNPHALGAWWPAGSPYAPQPPQPTPIPDPITGRSFTMDAEDKAYLDAQFKALNDTIRGAFSDSAGKPHKLMTWLSKLSGKKVDLAP